MRQNEAAPPAEPQHAGTGEPGGTCAVALAACRRPGRCPLTINVYAASLATGSDPLAPGFGPGHAEHARHAG